MKLDCLSCWSVGRLGLRGVGFGFGWRGSSVAVEATGLHGCDGLRILHEGLPDEGGAEIFRHEQAYAEIDAEDVWVVPVLLGMEGVAESVAAPGVLAIVVTQSAKDVDAFTRKEG